MRGFRPHRSPLAKGALAALALAVAAGGLGGCEKTTHENLDKWMNTEKGPGKLVKALEDSDLSPALRGHAAQNLIRIGKDQQVHAILDQMKPAERERVVGDMATRLWEDARITGKMSKPTPGQSAAKDALWAIRKYAGPGGVAQIDRYLTEWLTGGYYEGRAGFGIVRGEIIVQALGKAAAPGLIDAANTIIAAPVKNGERLRFEQNLLVGLAATGDPRAVGKLLDAIAAHESLGDKSLPKRGFFALHRAFVAPEGHPPANPAGLVPHISRLMKVVRDPETELEIIDAVLPLVQATGKDHCLPPLLGLIEDPPPRAAGRLRWIGAQRALLCGKLAAVKKVAEAFPTGGKYSKGRLEGSVWGYILEMKPPEKVAAAARELLSSRSWVARLTGVEVLDRLRYAPTAAKDAAAVAALRGDRSLLRGWWGDERGKKTPRLGERATEASKRLEELAKSPTN